MNDTLEYFKEDPIHRQYHQDALTFSMLYAFSENFLLPFSHDEVTHGKHSLLYRMPGDEWQRFANLRLLYTYMYTHPGKKLLFMGSEFAQGEEWNSQRVLDWYVLEYPLHQGIQRLVRTANGLYRDEPALHDRDFDGEGFEWIDCHDAQNSVLIYQRKGSVASGPQAAGMTRRASRQRRRPNRARKRDTAERPCRRCAQLHTGAEGGLSHRRPKPRALPGAVQLRRPRLRRQRRKQRSRTDYQRTGGLDELSAFGRADPATTSRYRAKAGSTGKHWACGTHR